MAAVDQTRAAGQARIATQPMDPFYERKGIKETFVFAMATGSSKVGSSAKSCDSVESQVHQRIGADGISKVDGEY
jgi:hypothetical protein